MGGYFGVASKKDCISDLFYGTDYHSHLGTRRGGLAVSNDNGIRRVIHDITNAQFRSKFEDDLAQLHGHVGIGVISDFEDQPLIICSHLGTYAIVTVGKINNTEELIEKALGVKGAHFSEMSGGEINPTEIVANLINAGQTFVEGIQYAQEAIDGSCSMLIMADEGIYAARDKYGRTPLVLGSREDACAATFETTAFPNLEFETTRDLGPGEIVYMTSDGVEQKAKPGDTLQICTFLWVYFGYPSSDYENINTEVVRNRCGRYLAENDDQEVDMVAGIPDSGTAHAVGYANQSQIPYQRPFVKYTPTWPRSFMPQNQKIRNLVAQMKLVPISELIEGQRMMFCEDSIVRGTQLQDTIQRVYAAGAKEIHMRPACPPLTYNCKFLNFSRSRSELDLAARRAIRELEGDTDVDLTRYTNEDSDEYKAMVACIRKRLGLTSLIYQRLDNLVKAVGLPKEKLCTYCWDGCEGCT